MARAWEDTFPRFSTREKGSRITGPPLSTRDRLGRMAAATFVLWIPVVVVAADVLHGISHSHPTWWQIALGVLYAMYPLAFARRTVDHARDRFGQLRTAYYVALVPPLAGTAVGLLIAGLRIGGTAGGWIALGSLVCSLIAAVAAILAWRGIRHTRNRRAWMTSLRQHGRRTPGVLREVNFLKKWSDAQPLFTVKVQLLGAERRWIAAHMVTYPGQVPLPGTAVVVFSAPHAADTDDVHIELDETHPVTFDPAGVRYVEPTGS